MKIKHYTLKSLVVLVASSLPGVLMAQNSAVIAGQDTTNRVITTAVPFLTFSPDSRHAGMGDAGVATSPDANSAHWNPAKFAFIEDDYGFALSYTPWLSRFFNDMSISYLAGFKRIDNLSTVAASLRYFDLGDIQLTDGGGNSLGEFNPREIALDVTYSRALSEALSIGLTGRFIHSNLSGSISASGNEGQPGVSVAADLGIYYSKDVSFTGRASTLSWGASISNIGSKITYNSAENSDFIPTNLRVGSALTTKLDARNKITFALDLNKLMVPSTPIYARDEDGNIRTDADGNRIVERGKNPDRGLLSGMFGSFGDAPDGFSEEIQEFMVAAGI